MKGMVIALIGVVILFMLVVISKIGFGQHVKIFGFEINDDIKKVGDTTKPKIIVKIQHDTIKTHDTAAKGKPILKYNIPKHLQSTVKTEKKADTVKNNKYTFNAPVEKSAVGDNATNNNYNFGIQPRQITRVQLSDFEAKHPDKNVYIDFVNFGSADAEMNNVRAQIAKILTDDGYTNVHSIWRVIVGGEEPQSITYQDATWGATFYVPTAR